MWQLEIKLDYGVVLIVHMIAELTFLNAVSVS